MAEKFGLVKDCQGRTANIVQRCEKSAADRQYSTFDVKTSKPELRNIKLWKKLLLNRLIVIGMIGVSAISIVVIVGLVKNGATSVIDNDVGDYFEKPENNRVKFGLCFNVVHE